MTGRFVPGAAPATPLVEQGRRIGARATCSRTAAAPPAGAPELDSSALASGAGKLGLGSSAAVAAAAVGAMLEAAGCDIEYTRTLAFSARRTAPIAPPRADVGSGADVAAAIHGGVVWYARRDGDGRSCSRSTCPTVIELIVFSTGTPSSTVDHVRALEAHAASDSRRAGQRLAAIGDARGATSCRRARTTTRAPSSSGGAREHRARRARARSIGLPIVTPALAAAAKLAEELGGAAKPSGAGGGDVGVAFLTDRGAAETFRQRAPHLGARNP